MNRDVELGYYVYAGGYIDRQLKMTFPLTYTYRQQNISSENKLFLYILSPGLQKCEM